MSEIDKSLTRLANVFSDRRPDLYGAVTESQADGAAASSGAAS